MKRFVGTPDEVEVEDKGKSQGKPSVPAEEDEEEDDAEGTEPNTD